MSRRCATCWPGSDQDSNPGYPRCRTRFKERATAGQPGDCASFNRFASAFFQFKPGAATGPIPRPAIQAGCGERQERAHCGPIKSLLRALAEFLLLRRRAGLVEAQPKKPSFARDAAKLIMAMYSTHSLRLAPTMELPENPPIVVSRFGWCSRANCSNRFDRRGSFPNRQRLPKHNRTKANHFTARLNGQSTLGSIPLTEIENCSLIRCAGELK